MIPRRCIAAVSACVPRTIPRTPASGSSGTTGLGAGSSAVGCGVTCGCSPGISSVLSNTLRPPSSTSVRLAPATSLACVLCASASIPFQSLNSASVAVPALTLSFNDNACSRLYPLILDPLPSPAKTAPNKASVAIVLGRISNSVPSSSERIALVPTPAPAPIPAPVATVLPSSCAARFAPNSWNNVLPACTNCFAPTVPITTEGAYSPAVA